MCDSLLDTGTPCITCGRSIDLNQLDLLLDIEPETKIYLANDSEQSAWDVINQLRAIGITQYQFIPWHHSSNIRLTSMSTVVTVGERHLLPTVVKDVTDIGCRLFDMSTLCDMIAHFNLSPALVNKVVHLYNKHITKL